jgi:hypothetical protein
MNEEEKQTKVIQTYEQPVEVDLTRSAKAQYHWKISVKAPIAALRMISDLDAELRHRFVEASASGLESGSPKPQAPAIGDPHQRMQRAIENVKTAENSPFRGE